MKLITFLSWKHSDSSWLEILKWDSQYQGKGKDWGCCPEPVSRGTEPSSFPPPHCHAGCVRVWGRGWARLLLGLFMDTSILQPARPGWPEGRPGQDSRLRLPAEFTATGRNRWFPSLWHLPMSMQISTYPAVTGALTYSAFKNLQSLCFDFL